jgi:hypothetical protein
VTGVDGVTYSTGGIITTGLSIGASASYQPRIHTAAVRTKAGWVGQILVDEEIVWESDPQVQTKWHHEAETGQQKALRRARERVQHKLAVVFA